MAAEVRFGRRNQEAGCHARDSALRLNAQKAGDRYRASSQGFELPRPVVRRPPGSWLGRRLFPRVKPWDRHPLPCTTFSFGDLFRRHAVRHVISGLRVAFPVGA